MIDLKNNTIDLDLFKAVLKEIKNSNRTDIIDSFSENQFKSKIKLLELIDQFNILDSESEVIIFGCWYGSILFPLLSSRVKRIIGIDLDEEVIRISKNKFFQKYNNLEYIIDDVFSKHRKRFNNCNLYINTSCEHMPPMKDWFWWNSITQPCYFAFQSNNMYNIEGHINCVGSLEEFKEQLPTSFEILYKDQLEDDRGIRYTLIGKVNPF